MRKSKSDTGWPKSAYIFDVDDYGLAEGIGILAAVRNGRDRSIVLRDGTGEEWDVEPDDTLKPLTPAAEAMLFEVTRGTITRWNGDTIQTHEWVQNKKGDWVAKKLKNPIVTKAIGG